MIFNTVTTKGRVRFMSNNKKDLSTGREYITAPFHQVVINSDKNWSSRVVINQDLAPINPLQCGKQICPSRYSYTSDDRDFWLLHFVISGKGTLTNRNGKQTVSKNEMFVIRPFENATYTADADDPWEYIWIGFAADRTVPPILEKSDVIYTPYLKDLFIRGYNADDFENIDTYGAYEHYLCGIIWEIFGLLLQNSKNDMNTANNYIKPALTIMELYYSDCKLTVTEIANRLRISQEHFSRIFKAEMGVSPKKYLSDIRMKRAVEFLTQSSESITQMAPKIGFPDVFAFSRAFTRYYGFPPSEYINKHCKEKTNAPET